MLVWSPVLILPLFPHLWGEGTVPGDLSGLFHLWHWLSLSGLLLGHQVLSISFTHVAIITSWQDPNPRCLHLHLCWAMHGHKSISIKNPTLNITGRKQQMDSPKHWNSNSVGNIQYHHSTMTLGALCLLLTSLQNGEIETISVPLSKLIEAWRKKKGKIWVTYNAFYIIVQPFLFCPKVPDKHLINELSHKWFRIMWCVPLWTPIAHSTHSLYSSRVHWLFSARDFLQFIVLFHCLYIQYDFWRHC